MTMKTIGNTLALYGALDCEAVGVDGIVKRFSRQELYYLARHTRGPWQLVPLSRLNKAELAEQILENRRRQCP
jgi:hypothetical protein